MTGGPRTWIQPHEMVREMEAWRCENASIGFVPTMGALHHGHLALVRRARELCDRVIVSIFVNPIQFGPNEDFAQYPHTLQQDIQMLSELDVDGIYLPNAGMMYPEGFQTYVTGGTMADQLCGASRPGHFNGVLTVVLKLCHQVRPHVAIFGKKDYQQWRLIERMAIDLDLNFTVQGAEIVREADGLAMSSRNRYLTESQRSQAACIYAGLLAAKNAFESGATLSGDLQQVFLAEVSQVPEFVTEYCEVRERNLLQPYEGAVDAQAVMLVAGRMGSTRLIDNLEFS